jgi:hypothetical protein
MSRVSIARALIRALYHNQRIVYVVCFNSTSFLSFSMEFGSTNYVKKVYCDLHTPQFMLLR